MRYPIAIVPIWRWLFAMFGWSARRSYAEVGQEGVRLHFGTADEQIPFAEIANIAPGHWPRYYGYGAKYGPKGGVSYVGSSAGVVQIDFVRPRSMNVWGPFGASQARCAIVSLENADQFIAEVRQHLSRANAA